MKKARILSIAVLVTAVSAVVILFVSSAFSATSKYEGRIVKDIEFSGIKKVPGKKEEIVTLRNVDGYSILKNQYIVNTGTNAGKKPEYNVIFIGQPLTQDRVRDSIKLLFKEGNLADVRVEVQEFGDGVKVRFFCEERPAVSRIIFKGLDKVQETDLKDKVQLRENQPFRQDLLDKSLPAIKKKYFEAGLSNCVLSYKVEPDPKKNDGSLLVTIIVDEGEDIRIARITVLGAKNIPSYELKALMETKEKGFMNDGNFKRDIFEQDKAKLLAYYKQDGYLDAEYIDEPSQISFEWDDPENKGDRARAIYITLKIKEGERYYFDGYTITGITGTVGNKDRGEFITKEKVDSMLELRKKEVNPLDRAVAYGVDLFTGNSDDDVICDNTLFEKDRHNLGFMYAGQGHVFARVTPTRRISEREKVINGKKVIRKYVTWDLDIFEGGEAHIEKIFIRGCKKTKEYVVRREVLMKEDENELFDSFKMQMTRERIYNLGFFKQVNIDLRPGSSENKMNILIDVEEQPTGTISLGGGYGTNTGFSIFADLGDKNFLGRGQSVNVRVEYGPQKTSGTLRFSEPWLFNKPVSFESAIYYSLQTWEQKSLFINTYETSTYQQQRFGYYMGPTYRFLYYYNIGLLWDHSFSDIVKPSGNSPDEVLIQKKLGTQETRTLKLRMSRNSVDNALNPTRGINTSLTASVVGGALLHGNSHYLKYEPGLEVYYSPFHLPFLDNYPFVMQVRAGGVFLRQPFNQKKVSSFQDRTKNDWLKSDDKLLLGGPPGYGTSGVLRGWTAQADPFPYSWQNGLYNQITYGGEIRVPIQPQYLWVVFFFDAGSLWSDKFWEQTLTDAQKAVIASDKANGLLYDITDFRKASLMNYFRYSYGFGFKVQIPMMPLRFWFGKKLLWNGELRKPFTKVGGFDFQFAIGDMSF